MRGQEVRAAHECASWRQFRLTTRLCDVASAVKPEAMCPKRGAVRRLFLHQNRAGSARAKRLRPWMVVCRARHGCQAPGGSARTEHRSPFRARSAADIRKLAEAEGPNERQRVKRFSGRGEFQPVFRRKGLIRARSFLWTLRSCLRSCSI